MTPAMRLFLLFGRFINARFTNEDGNEWVTFGILIGVALIIGLVVLGLTHGVLNPFMSNQYNNLNQF